MTKKESKEEKDRKNKVHFVVVREFTGGQTIEEVFGQLIEKQVYKLFEEWLNKKVS